MEKQYRVLAADDEIWCRESLKRLIEWEKYGIEFLEPACDGEEVLERLAEEKVDILLSDINMPFLSGLELMEKVSTEYPDVIMITISGYDDFEKVKRTFKAGGIDYLLKPVGQEELVEVLTKAFSILEEREVQEEEDKSVQLQKVKISSYLEDNEYSALLNKKLYDGINQGGYVPSNKGFSDITVALVKFYDIFNTSKNYNNDILQMSYSIKSKIRSLIPDHVDALVFNHTNKMSEYIIIAPHDRLQLQTVGNKILKEFDEKQYGVISVVVNEKARSLDDIGKIYREMILELVSRPFSKVSNMMVCDKNLNITNINDKFGKDKEEELYYCLRMNKKENARRLIFEKAQLDKCQESNWSYIETKQIINKIRNVFLEFYNQKCSDRINSAENLAEDIEHGLEILDYTIIKESIISLIENITEGNEVELPTSMAEQMEAVRHYIENNYTDNITLGSLADNFHVESSYLSRLFSQKYGETITSYITGVRMEHAKEMVKDKQKKLETISFLLGYDDYNYFSRVFRKRVGMSPSEYRKSLAS